MKYTALLFCVTGLATSSACAADGPVFYGRLVSGVDWTNRLGATSSTRWRSANSQWGTSLWGMRGEATLGGGNHAVFQLESGFDVNNGADDALFNRIARVALVSPRYGELSLGRDMKRSDGALWALDPGGLQFLGAATLLRGRAWGSRANAIGYRSPEWAGWTAGLQFAPGGHAGTFARGTEWSADVRYQRGPLMMTALYDTVRSDAPSGDAYDALFRHSRQYMFGATYAWRRAKFYLAYAGLRAPAARASADNAYAARRSDTVWAGMNWQASATLGLLGAVYHTRLDHGGGSATLAMVGANYALSKRTIVYASVGSVFNRGNANFAVEAGGTAADNPLPGGTQQGAYAGVAHWF
ncbi:porin [Chitinasiproducens palmae]|uniref:Outer membrane protein (Porin) n=1 Tax=Chitinasiproducens palmae TaxID=1770053 RepID=A0A1H2PP36_9BURK|nr:porin [Chitinasiproducens palmae]SDV48384.1 Outer membrane protein (porin) [Chitinasiproducens palmae]